MFAYGAHMIEFQDPTNERGRLDLKPYFGDLSLMTSPPVASPLTSPLRGASHLECTYTGETVESEALHGLSPAGKPYFARYDLEAIRPGFQPADLVGRRADLWRYEDVLPVRDRACQVSLGEGWTPLLDAPRLAARMGAGRVWIKDEGQNPTGSFKDRGLCLAVSRAKELGATALALPSAGNAASAQ